MLAERNDEVWTHPGADARHECSPPMRLFGVGGYREPSSAHGLYGASTRTIMIRRFSASMHIHPHPAGANSVVYLDRRRENERSRLRLPTRALSTRLWRPCRLCPIRFDIDLSSGHRRS